MRESSAVMKPSRTAEAGPRSGPPRARSDRRGRATEALARKILAHLPLAVAVIDANAALLFWNEQASVLFGVPPLIALERPALIGMLQRINGLTPRQRERITAFAAAHIAAGDGVEPEDCLSLSLNRAAHIVIQIHGLGSGRWMLVFDEGKVTPARRQPGSCEADAWLDFLTGLSNRRHFNEALQEAVLEARDSSGPAVLLIDLDHFALVNEKLGHSVGDALLALTAQRLRREIRDDDLLARLGGDEFALLIPNREGAEALAARTLDILAHPFLVEGQRVSISASIGVALCPRRGGSAIDLMQHAETALHQAQSAGHGTWRVFDAAYAEPRCTSLRDHVLAAE